MRPHSARQRRDASRVAAGGRAPVDLDDRPRPGRAARRRTIDSPRFTAAHALQRPRHGHARAFHARSRLHLAAVVRDAPGLLGKRDLAAGRAARRRRSTATTPRSSPHGDGYLVVCGEAISPAVRAADPYGAGSAAVVTNVSDVRAMGARPLAIVDMLVSPDRDARRAVLDGIAWAADKLGVPVVGGHMTLGHAPALSASCTGFAQRPLRASAARPGDVLIAAFALDGAVHERRPSLLHRAARPRPPALRTDGEALVEVAERGLCHAARDVSMPGVAGSLLQMIEGAGAARRSTSTRSRGPRRRRSSAGC